MKCIELIFILCTSYRRKYVEIMYLRAHKIITYVYLVIFVIIYTFCIRIYLQVLSESDFE